MTIDWGKIFSSVAKIRLTGGLVGRICTTLMITCLGICLMAAVAAASSDKGWIVALIAILAVSCVAYLILREAIKFAAKNPGAALLDGAHFIKHEQIVHESKYRVGLITDVDEPIEDAPQRALPPEELRELNEPDRELVALPRPVEKDGRNG